MYDVFIKILKEEKENLKDSGVYDYLESFIIENIMLEDLNYNEVYVKTMQNIKKIYKASLPIKIQKQVADELVKAKKDGLDTNQAIERITKHIEKLADDPKSDLFDTARKKVTQSAGAGARGSSGFGTRSGARSGASAGARGSSSSPSPFEIYMRIVSRAEKKAYREASRYGFTDRIYKSLTFNRYFQYNLQLELIKLNTMGLSPDVFSDVTNRLKNRLSQVEDEISKIVKEMNEEILKSSKLREKAKQAAESRRAGGGGSSYGGTSRSTTIPKIIENPKIRTSTKVMAVATALLSIALLIDSITTKHSNKVKEARKLCSKKYGAKTEMYYNCVRVFRKRSNLQKIKDLENAKKMCSKNKNPKECNKKIDEEINRIYSTLK